MPVDVAARGIRLALSKPAPGGACVFLRGRFRRHVAIARAEAAIVDREHRESEFAQLRDPPQLTGEIPARAVQVQDDRRIRMIRRPPPTVNVRRVRAFTYGQAHFLHACRQAAEPCGGGVYGTPYELALLGLEHAAAGGEQRSREERQDEAQIGDSTGGGTLHGWYRAGP